MCYEMNLIKVQSTHILELPHRAPASKISGIKVPRGGGGGPLEDLLAEVGNFTGRNLSDKGFQAVWPAAGGKK